MKKYLPVTAIVAFKLAACQLPAQHAALYQNIGRKRLKPESGLQTLIILHLSNLCLWCLFLGFCFCIFVFVYLLFHSLTTADHLTIFDAGSRALHMIHYSAWSVASWTHNFIMRPDLDAMHLWDKCEITRPCWSAQITLLCTKADSTHSFYVRRVLAFSITHWPLLKSKSLSLSHHSFVSWSNPRLCKCPACQPAPWLSEHEQPENSDLLRSALSFFLDDKPHRSGLLKQVYPRHERCFHALFDLFGTRPSPRNQARHLDVTAEPQHLGAIFL